MEVISLHVGIISRREGRSSVQMAAYCSRSKMLDEHTGRAYNYTQRSDLVYHEVMIPAHAPDMFSRSEILWNSVEEIEKGRNARLARAIIVALPKELDPPIHIAMVRRYVQEYFVQRGMCADVSIHDKGDGNPHAHILLTTRPLDCAGRWMAKQHRKYLLNENGERIFDPAKDGTSSAGASRPMIGTIPNESRNGVLAGREPATHSSGSMASTKRLLA